jgi:hypothetical protein
MANTPKQPLNAPKHQPPQVPKPGGGTQERSRNEDGEWRHKRNDAGHPRRSK